MSDVWIEGDLTFREMCKQEYAGNNCKFSSGFVDGHPVDTMYLRLEKDGEEPTTLLLRPDEVAALAWCANGVLWSGLYSQLSDIQSKVPLPTEAQELCDLMREISEDCHCASWVHGLEYDLWRIVRNGAQNYGQGSVSSRDVRSLLGLSERCGGWIRFDDRWGETFVPLKEWEVQYEQFLRITINEYSMEN